MLAGEFSYESRVVVVSQRRSSEPSVERAPNGFGAKPAEFRYDVLFLKAPLTSDERDEEHTSPRTALMKPFAGKDVVYFSQAHRQGQFQLHIANRRRSLSTRA